MFTYSQSAVHAGQVKVPPGYHPIDVEKEWGRLHLSIVERERLLRTEFERSADRYLSVRIKSGDNQSLFFKSVLSTCLYMRT